MAPKLGETMSDPACGGGGVLRKRATVHEMTLFISCEQSLFLNKPGLLFTIGHCSQIVNAIHY